jgi:hypothetical protein
MLTLLLAFQAAAAQPPAPPRSEVASLVARAKAARYQQDSTLARYEAIAKQRLSASIGLSRNLGLGPLGPERLAARLESAVRIGWDHEHGAFAELLAARSVAPLTGDVQPSAEDDDATLVLPYHPGRDRLWPIGELRDALPNVADWIAHPLADGADSLYLFSLGDSLQIRLPDKSAVRLREIRVRARRPDSRLIVGSLWVDVASGNLVRAAYRPSVPMDLWPLMEKDIGRNDRDKVKKLGPFTGTVREIIVEHGLYQGRFWLPKTRIANADGEAKGARVSLSIEQTFEYTSVAAVPSGAVANVVSEERDIDPRDGRVRRPPWHSVQQRWRTCRPTGDSLSSRWSADSLLRSDSLTVMYAEGVRFRVLLPCDQKTLIDSPLLPPSIYGSSEALFTGTDLGALRAEAETAIGMSEQAEWSPRPWMWHYGIDRGQLRYNRIEGLSPGLLVDRELGKGYTSTYQARIGLADFQVNGEASLRRSNARDDVTLTGYRRLLAANDWEDPFGVGASASALLFGRDDGFYFRSAGAEVTGTHRDAGGSHAIAWRIFAEREDSAVVKTQRSFANAVNGDRFAPNIGAAAGGFVGASVGSGFAWGTDPTGFRLNGSGRIELATGESSFGRGSAELTLARGFPSGVDARITGSAGAAGGDVPVQRLWYLGGPHTVRGHAPGAATGDAYWFGRVEIAKGHPLLRPSVFGDMGWAGPRANWRTQSAPISAAGVGFAFLEGLVRLDAARGLDCGAGWRVDFFFELR